MYINGRFYNYKYFVYDGCHKIYLIHKKDFKTIKARGYEKDDIHPVELLEHTYRRSCSLRFISRWDKLFSNIVPQCTDPDKVIFGKPAKKSAWKRTELNGNDFNVLEECAEKVFRHSDDWFYDEYCNRKSIDYEALCDLRDAWQAGYPNETLPAGAKIENSKIRAVWLGQE